MAKDSKTPNEPTVVRPSLDAEEATGTPGAGVSWSRPLATTTDDGARVVYVAVPNEDSLQSAVEWHNARMERDPRINALTTVIGLRQFAFQGDATIEDVLAEAAKVEAFIRTGKVPAKRKQKDSAE